MIELRYHPGERCFATNIRPGERQPTVYVTHGVEMVGTKPYEVTTYSFFYTENLAIGVGWRCFPRAKTLGYHPHDIEYVSVYSHDGQSELVYFAAHSRGQGFWVPWEKCEFSEGHLVVYVARNSHACYPHSGVYVRVFGMANDVCSGRGLHQVFTDEDLVPSYDHTFDNGIRLCKALRPAPPLQSMTALGRFLLPLSRPVAPAVPQ